MMQLKDLSPGAVWSEIQKAGDMSEVNLRGHSQEVPRKGYMCLSWGSRDILTVSELVACNVICKLPSIFCTEHRVLLGNTGEASSSARILPSKYYWSDPALIPFILNSQSHTKTVHQSTLLLCSNPPVPHHFTQMKVGYFNSQKFLHNQCPLLSFRFSISFSIPVPYCSSYLYSCSPLKAMYFLFLEYPWLGCFCFFTSIKSLVKYYLLTEVFRNHPI